MADARSVPPGFRVVNLLILLLFLTGAGLYARAWIGLQALTTYESTPGEPLFSAMARFDQLWGLSITGAWLVWGAVFGAAAVAFAFNLHRRAETGDAPDAGEAEEARG